MQLFYYLKHHIYPLVYFLFYEEPHKILRFPFYPLNLLSFKSSRTFLRSLFSLGKKPLKINEVVSNPEYTKAVVIAVAPGRTSNPIPSSIHLHTITLPGSDIPGVPASVTIAISFPCFNNSIIFSLLPCSLCL